MISQTLKAHIKDLGDGFEVRRLLPAATRKMVGPFISSAARIMAFDGAAMDGDRFISWNFVASSKELIEDARNRWREQRFPGVPGETEFIPLPER